MPRIGIKQGAILIIAVGVVAGLSLWYTATKTDSHDTTESVYDSLSKQEKAILALPKSDASAKRENASLIESASQEVEVLSIAECLGRPTVVRIQEGESLRIANEDDVDHTLEVDRNNVFFIEAHSEKEIVADFGSGHGIYSYTCDTSGSVSDQQEIGGMILVLPPAV